MGRILGLGITHYPGLAFQGNISRRIKMCLADPALPEKFRSLDNWPKPMREQWGADEGRAHSEVHRHAMIDGFRRARAALEEFNPDFCVIWGDDQFENYREDCVPPFSILAYESVEVQPWLRDQRGANSWNEPKEKSFLIRGHREGAKYLASRLLNEGFDIPYAYKPRHAALGHAFTNSILFLDWDRRGFRYPVVPFTTNAYGRYLMASEGIPPTPSKAKSFLGNEDPPGAAAMALLSNRCGNRTRVRRKPVESRVDRIIQLVTLVFNRKARAHVSGRRVGPALFRGAARGRLGNVAQYRFGSG
jgi:hypothetical protein